MFVQPTGTSDQTTWHSDMLKRCIAVCIYEYAQGCRAGLLKFSVLFLIFSATLRVIIHR
jgi:hypothetical protein